MSGYEAAQSLALNDIIVNMAGKKKFGISLDVVLFEELARCRAVPLHMRKNRQKLGRVLVGAGFGDGGVVKVHGIRYSARVRKDDGVVDTHKTAAMVKDAVEVWQAMNPKNAVLSGLAGAEERADAATQAVADGIAKLAGPDSVDRVGRIVELAFDSFTQAAEFERKMKRCLAMRLSVKNWKEEGGKP
jgi:hypothetical protein